MGKKYMEIIKVMVYRKLWNPMGGKSTTPHAVDKTIGHDADDPNQTRSQKTTPMNKNSYQNKLKIWENT